VQPEWYPGGPKRWRLYGTSPTSIIVCGIGGNIWRPSCLRHSSCTLVGWLNRQAPDPATRTTSFCVASATVTPVSIRTTSPKTTRYSWSTGVVGMTLSEAQNSILFTMRLRRAVPQNEKGQVDNGCHATAMYARASLKLKVIDRVRPQRR
jgi:hypothetical protein